MEIKPIAYIYTDFKEKFGIPRQSGRIPELKGRIVFQPEYNHSDAVRGLEEYSHIWLIFGFSQAERKRDSRTVRPPRLGGNQRVGVFASRSPFRPNGLGLSVVRLEGIEETEKEGIVLQVSGIDMLNGTPIYDIKPYLPYADCQSDAKGSYGEQWKDYKLQVIFPDALLTLLPEEKREAVIACLADDPRPSYHQDQRMYSMNFAGYEIRFSVEEDKIIVCAVE